MNRFHPIGCAVEIPHAYDVEVAVKCLVHIPTCVRWRKESHLGWGLHTDRQTKALFLNSPLGSVEAWGAIQ